MANASCNVLAPLVSKTSAQLAKTCEVDIARIARGDAARALSPRFRRARRTPRTGRLARHAVSRRGGDGLGCRPLHLVLHRRPVRGRGPRLRRCCSHSTRVSPATDTSGRKIPAYFITVIPCSRGSPRLGKTAETMPGDTQGCLGTTIAPRPQLPMLGVKPSPKCLRVTPIRQKRASVTSSPNGSGPCATRLSRSRPRLQSRIKSSRSPQKPAPRSGIWGIRPGSSSASFSARGNPVTPRSTIVMSAYSTRTTTRSATCTLAPSAAI